MNRRPYSPFLAASLAIAIFIADTLTDVEIAFAVLYVVVVLMSVSFFDRRGVLLVSAACLALTVISYVLAPGGDAFAGLVNMIISLTAIGATTYLSVASMSAGAVLRERDALIRRLIDANIIGIFIWDFEGHILEANDAFLRMVGYEREDLVAGRMSWTELTPADWHDREVAIRQEHVTSGLLPPFEKEYFRKDGSRVPVLIGAATFEEGGNEGVAFALDLTERKRAEQALGEREAKIRGLFEANIIAVFIGDIEGQVIEANDAFFHMLGYDREDVVSGGLHRTRITPPEWSGRDAQTRAQLERLGRMQPFEKEYWRKDGSRVPVLVGATVFAPDRVVAFALDISERKRAERALRESEEQWKAVFENNPTMYFMVDTGGIIESVNPLGAEQLGFTVDELSGSPVQNLFHPDDREAVARNAEVCFKQPGQTMSWEARKIRKDGEVLWVREMARVMLIKDRPVALIVCEDITERKRVSEVLGEVQMELAHANRVATMGQLTASIAHEVNQPIAATVTNAQAALRWLRAQPPDLEEVEKTLTRIVRDGARAGDVIGRIRELVKKAPLQKEPLEMNEAIQEVIELTRGEAVKDRISVRTELAGGLPLVFGDRVQLQQVMLNLIVNAFEAMSGTGEGMRELQIRTGKADSGDVLVSVRDTGPGLAPANLDRLFDAFYTTKPSGLGMGLSICRSIIEGHGGRLWASENTPRGVTFCFTVPACADAGRRRSTNDVSSSDQSPKM